MVVFSAIFGYRKKTYSSRYNIVYLNKCPLLGHIFLRFFVKFLIKIGYVYIGCSVHVKVIRWMLYNNYGVFPSFLVDNVQ